MIGEGPKKADIAELAARYALSNLTMLPEQPREDMPDYLSAADVAIIPLRNLDLFKGALPSKLFDAWACQRPVLLSSIDGEARHVLELAGGGICVPPEDPTLIAEALIVLRTNPLNEEQWALEVVFIQLITTLANLLRGIWRIY